MSNDTDDPIDVTSDDTDDSIDVTADDTDDSIDVTADDTDDEVSIDEEEPSQEGEENKDAKPHDKIVDDTGKKGKGRKSESEETEEEPPIDFSRKSRANSDEAGFAKARMKDFSNFYRIFGDHVGRDQFDAARDLFINPIIMNAGTAAQTPTDPGFEIAVDYEALMTTFVPPNDMEDALELLRQHGALIISGTPGNGRRTLAYYLMRQLEFSQEIKFRQLPNTSSLLEPNEEAFGQVATHRAYLLIRDEQSWKGLKKDALNQLVGRVCQKQSYIIIIWEEILTLSHRVPWHIHLGAHNVPQPIVVFKRHIEYLLESHQISVPAETLRDILGHSKIRQLLSEANHLKRVVEWAAFVAALLQDEHSVIEIVQQCQQQQGIWLRQDALELVRMVPSQAHLCLRIAAAVMSNIHVNAFKELADLLQKALNDSFDKKSRKTWREFWNGPRSHWLEAAHAKVEPMMEWIDERRVRTDVMKTVPEMLSIPLIEAFWEEYPKHQDPFLRWLEQCGRHKNFHVRFAAARTISVLFLRNPHRIEKPIIISWAKAEHVALKESAAMSLAMACAQSPSTMRVTRKLLKKWSRISDKNRQVKIELLDDDDEHEHKVKLELFFASAIVYAWLGIDSPQEFINGIHQLVTSRDILFYIEATIALTDTATLHLRKESDTRTWRLKAVRFAFQRFLQLSELKPSNNLMLLRRMLKWTKSNSHIQRLIGRIVFVDLMLVDEGLNVTTWEEQESKFAPRTWPILLRLMQRTKQAPVIAARLFEYTTASRRTKLAAWGGLKRMVIFAGKEPEARNLLKRFIYTLIADSKRLAVARELKRKLQHWAKTSQSAAKPAPYSKNLLVWLYDNHLL